MTDIVRVPKILLPKEGVDLSKWSVVACDQYTSEVEYWEELEKVVDGSPSTLDLILPEVYLTRDNSARIAKINSKMAEYLQSDFFREEECMILVKRTLASGQVRLGLMIAVDLDAYEYTPHNMALIKATEMTVESRLPARIEVRQNACLEVPHIMLLIDDPEGEIIENLYSESDDYDKLYDVELNMGGGHVTGFRVPDGQRIIDRINKFVSPEYIRDRYKSDHGMLFAVGDGNHSLATAKACWNRIKEFISPEERVNHPARFALVELVNLHDESLVFEPIHRLLVGAKHDFVEGMQNALTGEGRVRVRYGEDVYTLAVPANPSDAIKDIQDYIDSYMATHSGVYEDYIHGDNNLTVLLNRTDAVGIYMPTLSKNGFFDYVARRGVLPRKSFSMGEAHDKRYYMECRKIVK